MREREEAIFLGLESRFNSLLAHSSADLGFELIHLGAVRFEAAKSSIHILSLRSTWMAETHHSVKLSPK